ncbi:hypothetical protein M1D88_17985 [Arthrobacter sp. R1-13]
MGIEPGGAVPNARTLSGRARKNDLEEWQDPHYGAPYLITLVENFEQLHDGTPILDLLKSPVTEADPEFFDLVKAYWAQLYRDGSPLLPVTADEVEFKALSKRDAAVTIERLDLILNTVFDWMTSQGKSPIPGRSEWISIYGLE